MKRFLPILAAGALVITAAGIAPANATMRGPEVVNPSAIVQVDHRRWDGYYTNWKPRHSWNHRRHSRHHWRRHNEPQFGFFFNFGPPRHYDRRYRYHYYD